MKMKRHPSISAVTILLLGGMAAQATTLARMSLDELASAAHVVAQAQCLESESRWEGGAIWTFTQFEVIQTMKGAAPRLITVRLPGGRVGHLQSFVDGAPRFQPGEEVILFLERTRAGDFSVTSWVQGTFRIHRDASTGRGSVTQDSSGFAVFDPATRKFRSAGVRNLPLEQFKQRVAEAVGRRARGRQP